MTYDVMCSVCGPSLTDVPAYVARIVVNGHRCGGVLRVASHRGVASLDDDVVAGAEQYLAGQAAS